MRKIGYLSIIGALLFAVVLFSFVSKDNEKNDNGYIVLDVYEVSAYDDKGIHIHYDDHTDFIPFRDMKKEFHDDNGELLVRTLNDLREKGYKVVNTSSGKSQKSGLITKIFMEKE